jgi:hypothetical protein
LVIREFKYLKVLYTDKNGHIPIIAGGTNFNSLDVRIETNFKEKITIITYINFDTLFANLGGYHASYNAIWKYVLPIFILYFLYNLALYIKLNNKNLYETALINSLHKIKDMLENYI